MKKYVLLLIIIIVAITSVAYLYINYVNSANNVNTMNKEYENLYNNIINGAALATKIKKILEKKKK